ncbi:hypothetical protein EDD41_1420 [Luteococcus japonicus]|uniref:Uncharacterized protein n=2 Tax=Luteococcus japonicus TaxID=33984 RepID=A0A3N1ZTP6_9ACTN|nr:hypothetical protein EDD41_1420 [Luteococcus japonicus]
MYAICIDEVRDMFGATPAIAGTLRQIASETFRGAPVPPRAPGMLGKLGPLFARAPEAPLVPHGTPLPSDVENLLAGRFVAPERLGLAWQVVDAWLGRRSLARHVLHRTPREVDQLEFELTRAGLPSQFGIGKLQALDAQIPLRPLPGMSVGYCKHAHVLASGRALQAVLPDVLPHSHQRAAALADFLTSFETLAGAARANGRPLPDLFVTFDRG